MSIESLTERQLSRVLAYAGLVLVAFELVKSLIVAPIRHFYRDVTFGPGMPFKSYEEDVLSRNRNEFEACLLYLRDFMQVIDSSDVLTIQGLRKHRNDLAHDLVERISAINIADYAQLLDASKKILFKLSNHRAYMEIGSDPAFRAIDWCTFKGDEYVMLESILSKVNLLSANSDA